MKVFALFVACALTLAGCALSRNESTLARLHDEMKNKKKEMPKGFMSEAETGMRYYPDADGVSSKEYDENGAHVKEVVLNTSDSEDKVKDYYEKLIGAKAVPVMPPVSSIQADANGKHYDVTYGRFGNDTTITIKVSSAQR